MYSVSAQGVVELIINVGDDDDDGDIKFPTSQLPRPL